MKGAISTVHSDCRSNLEAASSGQCKSANPILAAAVAVGLSSASVRGGFDLLGVSGSNRVPSYAPSFNIRDLVGRSIDFSTSAVLDSACTAAARYGECSVYPTYCGEIRSASTILRAKARVLHRLRFVFGFVVSRPPLFFAGLCLQRRRHILAVTRAIEKGRAVAAAVMAAAAPAPGEDQASAAAAAAAAKLAAAADDNRLVTALRAKVAADEVEASAAAAGMERGNGSSDDQMSCTSSVAQAPAMEAGECYCPARCKEEARLRAVVNPVGNAATVASTASASAAAAAAAKTGTIPPGPPLTSPAISASAAKKGGCCGSQTFARVSNPVEISSSHLVESIVSGVTFCCSCGKAPNGTRFYCRPCHEMGCKVTYCGQECQRSHWRQHKPNCCRRKTHTSF